jgi:ubiquinone biosynthesis protein UbiJ
MHAETLWLSGWFREKLERAVQACLELDPGAVEVLQPMAGKLIALRLRPLPKDLYLCPTDRGVQFLTEIHGGSPDTRISGTPLAFVRMGLGGDAQPLLFGGEVMIEGDAELARQFQEFFGRLQLDWQGLLAQQIGDEPAFLCFETLRAGKSWVLDSSTTFHLNLKEFLQQEVRLLPARVEADSFMNQVDRLRADAERLEARIRRLQDSATNPGAPRT